MPFSIKDDEVKDLADELQNLIGAKNRTDTIRRALKTQITIARRSPDLHSVVELLQTINPDFERADTTEPNSEAGAKRNVSG